MPQTSCRGDEFAMNLNMLPDYVRQAKIKCRKMESMFDLLLQSFESQVNEALFRLPREIRQLTLGQLLLLKVEPVAAAAAGDQDLMMIRPKFEANAPLSILRRPKHGEIVLSMQGSPILVSGIVAEKTANINVPLADGTTVMSIMPSEEGLQLSLLPALDNHTVQQLRTLKRHIDQIIENQ